jgi:hypothetical protein
MPTDDYHNRGKYCHALLSGLLLFRLVVPPLQLGVVGPYPVWGVWLLSHLLLEGTECIQIFWP